jgi:hypothetical protein
MTRKQSSSGQDRSGDHKRKYVPLVPAPTTPGYQYPPVLGAGEGRDSLPKEDTAGLGDDEIRARVLDAIDSRSDIPENADFHVEVQSGVVTLSGTTLDDYAKRAAVEVAASVPSVSDVNDEIRVNADPQ